MGNEQKDKSSKPFAEFEDSTELDHARGIVYLFENTPSQQKCYFKWWFNGISMWDSMMYYGKDCTKKACENVQKELKKALKRSAENRAHRMQNRI